MDFIDTDEFASGTNDCHAEATWTNTNSSFVCKCNVNVSQAMAYFAKIVNSFNNC
jgi:hypothetical protein